MATSIEGLTKEIDARLAEARDEQARLTAAREVLTAARDGSFQQPPKRRGRPRGSKNRTRVQLPELDAHLATGKAKAA